MPAKDVYLAAEQGCSGCKVIAWALEPYMEQHGGLGKRVRICFDRWYFPESGSIAFHQLEYYTPFLPVEKVSAEIAIQNLPYTWKEGYSFPYRSECHLEANMMAKHMILAKHSRLIRSLAIADVDC